MTRQGMRAVEAPSFAEGKTRGVTLQERHVLSMLLLRTGYDFDVSGGSGAGDILSDAAYRVAQEITVQADGSPLHNVNGHTLGKIQKLLGREEYSQTDPTTDAAGTSEADRESFIPIPFSMPYSKRPHEFGLPTPTAKARLLVKWLSGGDLVDGEDGAIALSNVDPDLYEVPIYGVPAEPYSKWGAVSIRKIEKDVVSDGQITVDFDHLTNGQELRLVIIEGMAQGANADEFLYNDSVVTDVGPLDIANQEEFESVPFSVLQQRNKVAYQLSALETGVGILDAAEDRETGRGELWTVRGSQRPFLKLDVAKQTNDTKVIVTTVAGIRGRVPQGAGSRGAASGRGR